MGRGAWQATVHGVTQLDVTEQLSTASEQNSVAWPPSSPPWPFPTLSGTYLGTLRCWQNPGWVYSLMSGVDSHVSFEQCFFFFRPVWEGGWGETEGSAMASALMEVVGRQTNE